MRESLRSLRRNALRLAALGLTLFHVQLLWKHWADGTLTDFTVVARWLASGLLIGGLVIAYRRHGSAFRSREALVLWTLVILLHALAGTPAGQMVAEPAPWLAIPMGLVVLQAVGLLVGARSEFAALQRLIRSHGPVFVRPILAGHAAAPGGRAPPC